MDKKVLEKIIDIVLWDKRESCFVNEFFKSCFNIFWLVFFWESYRIIELVILD